MHLAWPCADEKDLQEKTSIYGEASVLALLQVVGFNMDSSRKYVFSGAFSEAALGKFGRGIVDGTVKPNFASEEVPKEPTDEGVTVVVGKTFDEVC